jgi:NADPH-dependent curcumin reductase
MSEKNVQVLLARRPTGEVRESDFEVVQVEVPSIHEGQFLVRNHYLSLDPYMRGRMSDAPPTPSRWRRVRSWWAARWAR